MRFALAALVLLTACASPAPQHASVGVHPASTMRVHFIDVGQGAATLFEFDDGAVLVDTGGEQNDYIDSNTRLKAYLDAFFKRREDLHRHLASLVLTHPHLDHTRGVHTVIENFAPQHVVTNGQTKGSGAQEQNDLMSWASENHVAMDAVHLSQIPPHGLTDNVIDPVHGTDVDPVITALWGQVDTDPGWGSATNNHPRFDNQNNHCVVLRVDFGKASVLVTGDLEEIAIKDMIKRYEGTQLLDVDVYEVGHHGSINGTTPELVAAMSPTLAVIEVGRPDHQADYCAWKFGHPRAEIIAMLENGVSMTRPEIRVQLGRGSQSFEDHTVSKAIYATAWDGSVVLEARADGVFRQVAADVAAAP
jgi:competence protein ComEC